MIHNGCSPKPPENPSKEFNVKFEIKLWKRDEYGDSGEHISTLIVDVGTIYDDWYTAPTDPRKFVIGREGKGTAKICNYGALYLREHYLGRDILLTANWNVRAGHPIVGMTGFGKIDQARPSSWNGTKFTCKVTRKFTWLEAAAQHAARN